jgi:hypothetical protein
MTLHEMNEMLPVWGVAKPKVPSIGRTRRAGVAFTHGFCQRPDILKRVRTIEDGLLLPGKIGCSFHGIPAKRFRLSILFSIMSRSDST